MWWKVARQRFQFSQPLTMEIWTRQQCYVLRRTPTHLQSPVEGFWYGDTGGLSRAVGRDRRDESVQLVPKEGGKFIFSFPRIIISETSNS